MKPLKWVRNILHERDACLSQVESKCAALHNNYTEQELFPELLNEIVSCEMRGENILSTSVFKTDDPQETHWDLQTTFKGYNRDNCESPIDCRLKFDLLTFLDSLQTGKN